MKLIKQKHRMINNIGACTTTYDELRPFIGEEIPVFCLIFFSMIPSLTFEVFIFLRVEFFIFLSLFPKLPFSKEMMIGGVKYRNSNRCAGTRVIKRAQKNINCKRRNSNILEKEIK